MNRTASHTSRMCRLQSYRKLSSSGVEMKCSVDPQQPLNMLAHEEERTPNLPVPVQDWRMSGYPYLWNRHGRKEKKLTVQDYLLLVAHPWVILLPSSPKLSLALFYVSWSWTAFFAWELYRGKQKTEVWLTSMNFSLSAGRAFELNPGTFAVYEL